VGRGSATASASTARGAGAGQRCLPEKLLLDPYAKAIEGGVDWDEAVFSYRFDDPEGPQRADSARFVRVGGRQPFFDWGNDRPPRRRSTRR
jgi:isoamylase